MLAVGGTLFVVNRPQPGATGTAPTPSPSPAATPGATASPAARLDYSDLPGRILVEHLGNALDLSEQNATDYNPDKRRFYFMDPTDMSSGTAVEFLPGQPATGKSAADISNDGRKVVFQDWSEETRLYEANLDGTGLRRIPVDCTCALLYPDYDPTATRIVDVRVEGEQSWLEIRDLATGRVTKIESTTGPAADAVPEQPAWSPDGRTIAFSRITWGLPNDHDIGTVHFGDRAPLSAVLSLLDVAAGTVTTLPIPPNLVPGDPNWAPDSRTIVFAAGPLSTTAGITDMPHWNYAIQADGTGLNVIPGIGSPEFLPDGRHILYKTSCIGFSTASCDTPDSFGVMLADFSAPLWVQEGGMDLTDLPQGFSQVAHWVPDAP